MTPPPGSRVENRLRDAYQAVVEAVQPDAIRDLHEPRRPAARTDPARRSGWLIPVAAAAAVILTIGVAATVPRLLGRPANGSAPASTASQGVARALPFLVDSQSSRLQVRSAATGHVLATLVPPHPGSRWTFVAATGNPAKFVVGATQPSTARNCPGSQPSMSLYTLTLSASGKPSSLTPLPTVPGQRGGLLGTGDVAVSADGGTIAYTTAQCGDNYNNPSSLMTINVIRNGAVRTWTASWFANPTGLSLSADGSELGYVDLTEQSPASSLGSAWVLPTDSAPGSAADRSHKVFTDVMHGGIQAQSEILSPDGRRMYILTATRGTSSEWMTDGVSAVDTANGALLHRLHTWGHIDEIPPRITAGAGNEALVWDMHETAVDEVNLVTGAARTFRQLPISGIGSSFQDLAW